jgi:hypothetical protein
VTIRLAQRRTIWWPTGWGWGCLSGLIIAGLSLWWFGSEAFLSSTHRVRPDLLVVEGWIGIEGLRSAKTEFESGGYRYLVTTSGVTENHWGDQQWIYAKEAAKVLIRAGIPDSRIIVAIPLETGSQRTFESASATWRILQARGITPLDLNVFTLGPHARRSRLVFAKVFGSNTRIGDIGWMPASYSRQSWWQSSERASDLVKENAGYLYERLFNSGRSSNSPAGTLAH